MTRTNRFRTTLEDGGVAVGARTGTVSPALVEIYGQLGFDFAWLDFEHAGESPWDSVAFEHLTRAAELAGVELLVRIPSGDPALIRKVLDAGVRNLLVPRVEDAEEVYHAVEATRFAYDGGPGGRGAAGWRSSDYGTMDDYYERADRTVCLGVMLETAAALENLDAILDVPALGFVFVGPADLSIQLGHPGDRDHPEVTGAIAEIEERALDADVPLAGISHDVDGALELVERGYRAVRLGGDLEAARQVLGDRLDRLNERRGASP